MNKNIFNKWMILIFDVFLLVFIVATIPIALIPDNKTKKILAEGESIVADAIDYRVLSNDGGSGSYNLLYYFTTENGEQLSLWGKASYDKDTVLDAVNGNKKIRIKYLDGDICEADYKNPLAALLVLWYFAIAAFIVFSTLFLFFMFKHNIKETN